MFRSQDDSRPDLGLGHTRHDPDEINYKLRRRVGYDCQVGIDTPGNILSEFNVKLALILDV